MKRPPSQAGKFYRPAEKLKIPVYLDKEVNEFYSNRSKSANLNKIVNTILRKEMEMLKAMGVW